MTSSARTGAPRQSRWKPAQSTVGAVHLLAVIASVFLIFSDSVELLRVGLVAALWALFVGSIAVAKYRRQSAVEQVKARELQAVYELQLERDVSARREYELDVQAGMRREADADATELAALRAELAALRLSLEVLFDGGLPVTRVALRADSAGVVELAASAADHRAPAPAYGDEPNRPQFATPYDEPVTAETTEMPDPEIAETETAETGTAESGIAQAGSLPEPAAGSRRRRRALNDGIDNESGDHTSGLTVAQIMANLRAEHGGVAVGQRSRRRDK